MPLFDPDSIRTIVGDLAEGEQLLDLRGASLNRAQAALDHMLAVSQGKASCSVVIRIDPATATSGETLFLPLGRQLLEARKTGRISRLLPLPEGDGGGFYVELAGRARSEDAGR